MLDQIDRKILQSLQKDADISLEALAKHVGSSKTPVWNRVKKLRKKGIIKKNVALVDAKAVGLENTFYITVRTSQHEPNWLEAFTNAIHKMPEIQEAHRLAGEVDYILKVRVKNAQQFDDFYKRFIAEVPIFNVTSSLSMETIKSTTQVQIP